MNPPDFATPPSLPGQRPEKLTYAQARNCLLVNQFATPGLGSLWGRRWLAGGGQLALALAGFGLFLVWFGKTCADYYRLMFDSPSEPVPHTRWAVAGLALMGVAWCWSWFTSISLLREAKRLEKQRLGQS